MKTRLLSIALAAGVGLQFLAVRDVQAARKKARKSATAVAKAPDAGEESPPPSAIPDPAQPPNVRAQSVLVFEPGAGRILYEKNADVRRPIASTQKLLTALLIVEAGNLDQRVQATAADVNCEPTNLDFRPGEIYSRRELVTALLVHSCNDVARCLARDNAGSYEAFADRMNLRVAQLGGRDSHFVNPNGLPSPGQPQYSTARDLARIARVAYASPLLRSIVATRRLTFQYNSGRVQEFTNTNKVLARYPLCNGMKTGYTNLAGHCLVSSATNGTRTVISVCLGDNKSIWNDSQSLLAWGLIAEQRPTDSQL